MSVPSNDLMAAILNQIDYSTTGKPTVYLHCWGGVGRTGTVVGCGMLRHRLTERDNVLEVLARFRQQDQIRGRRRSPETQEQECFVLERTEGDLRRRHGGQA